MAQRFKYLLPLATGLLLVTQPGASCLSDSSSDEPTRNTPSRDNPSRDGRNEESDRIPQRADIVAEGRGELTFKADADGELFVQDLKDERTILQRRITRGQRVTVFPDDNRIRLDDDTVSKSDLKREHTHRIYLLRDRRFEDNDRDRSEDRDRVNDRTIDRRPGRDVEPLPSGAQLMGEGRNREIDFIPSVNGKAYIYDETERRVVAVVDVRAKKRFVFSPGADRASVDGKRVLDDDFDTRVHYRVYFGRP
jgi:hypothetical protein